MRAITYHPQMLDDLKWWLEHDRVTGRRVALMIDEIIASPTKGTGKPKKMAGMPGVWSRRVNHHHRIQYVLSDEELFFVCCRGHDMPAHLYDALHSGEEV